MKISEKLRENISKSVRDPASNWLHCMLDTVGKISEQAIEEQLRKHFQGKCTSSANQYGFRTDRSTIDTVRKLKKLVVLKTEKRQWGAVFCLNIQNAFNSIPHRLWRQ